MDWVADAFAVVAAPCVGSFAGVLVRRLPAGRRVSWGRSACEGCGAMIPPRDLMPVASFLALRGRCRACGAAIAPMHLWIELAALLVPLSAWAGGVRDPAVLWAGCGLGWTLLALGWIDATALLLPDVLTLPLVVGGLAACWWFNPALLADHAMAAALGWLGLAGVAAGYRRLRGRAGLGGGDAKLLAAGGAWLGLGLLPWALLAGAVLGLLAAGVQAARGRAVGGGTKLPFGPWLAMGIWVCWVWSG